MKLSGSISVSGDLRFGGLVTYAWSGNLPEPWAHLRVYQGDRLVEEAYSRLLVDPSDVLGPTPSWSGGPAKATVELAYWNSRQRLVPVASVSFEVAA